MSTTSAAAPAPLLSFLKNPLVLVIAGCIIAIVTFGPRSSFGFFLTPMSAQYGWGRDVFALAFAVQNLLWGLGTPFAGAIADRFGTAKVLAGGAVLYCIGLALMTYSTTPLTLNITGGVLIGFGLSGCSFNIVLTAFGKLVAERMAGSGLWRRHGRRFVRAIPVRAVRRRDDPELRLAICAARILLPRAARHSVCARATDREQQVRGQLRQRHGRRSADAAPGARRSLRTPLVRFARHSASSPAASSSRS